MDSTQLRSALAVEGGTLTLSRDSLGLTALWDTCFQGQPLVIRDAAVGPGDVITGRSSFLQVHDAPTTARFWLDASGQPQAALNYELTAITAVIVGGASLGGGRGTIGGTILGVFLLGLVSNALNLYGVSAFWQPVATGTILVLAVGIDSYSSRGVFAWR